MNIIMSEGLKMIDKRTLDELVWICDFNGHELGFPEEEDE